jgi:hypothetical protein
VQLLEAITNRAKEEGLELLLAGGHAVIVHGYQRVTFDVDLAIRRTDRDRWLELMRTLGFTLFQEGPAFIQFNPPPGERLPVDLIHLDDEQIPAASRRLAAKPADAIRALRHFTPAPGRDEVPCRQARSCGPGCQRR